MKCPRRDESVFGEQSFTGEDWGVDGTCQFCGSVKPEVLFETIDKGEKLTPTDKNYKVYVRDQQKFYFQHLSQEERQKFVDLFNSGVIQFETPGYFYVTPFFMRFKEGI